MAQNANSNWTWQYQAAIGDIETFARSVADPQKRRALQKLANHYLGLVAAGLSANAAPSPGS